MAWFGRPPRLARSFSLPFAFFMSLHCCSAVSSPFSNLERRSFAFSVAFLSIASKYLSVTARFCSGVQFRFVSLIFLFLASSSSGGFAAMVLRYF